MTKILLIRHGKSVANDKDLFGGITDYLLSEQGHIQARDLAERLKNMDIDVIYSSPLSRAVQTIEPIAEMLDKGIKVEDDLKEIYVGMWEATLRQDLIKEHPEIFETEYYSGMEGQEETADVAKRMLKVITKIAKENEGKTVAIASHIVAIRAFLCTVMGIPFEQTKEKIGDMGNTNITILNYDSSSDKFDVIQLKDNE